MRAAPSPGTSSCRTSSARIHRPASLGRTMTDGEPMDDLSVELVVTADGPVRLIELNRPEQRNAASEALHTALAGVWDRLAADEQVRAVVLTGRGRAFRAGGDFHGMTRVSRVEAFRAQNTGGAR